MRRQPGKTSMRSVVRALVGGWCLLALTSRGQPGGYADQLWQVPDGLPNTQVRAITQTRDGFLLVGTVEGLARFDGLTFATVERRTLRDMIRQFYIGLAEARDGSVWFSNGQGLSRHFDGQRAFYGTNDGLPSEYVLTILCDSGGQVIAGTDKGIRVWRNGRFVSLAENDPVGNAGVRAIIEDKKGNLWIGAANGLFCFRDGKWITVFQEQTTLRDKSVLSLAEGTNGCVWAGTADGLTRIDENGITNFTSNHGLLTNAVRALCRAGDGTLWVGTSSGLQRLVDENLPFIRQTSSFAAEFDWARESVYTIFEDEEHNIWAGTNHGLMRLKRERFKVYSVREGLPSRVVNAVLEDSRGRVWIGTASGIARLEGGKIISSLGVTNQLRTNTFPRTPVLSLLEDDQGEMWFGTRIGVYRWRTNELLHYTVEKSKLADNIARCMLQLTPKLYFIGHDTGLTRYRFELFTNYSAKTGVSFTRVRALAEGRETRLWVGSEDGLTVFKGEANKRFTMKDGLSSDWINALYMDAAETLWIGTENGGLDRFKNGRVTAITPSASGIFGERIYSIVEDEKGNLWMGSRRGIFRASRKELQDFADGKITGIHCVSYGKADGLKNIQCSGNGQPAAFKGRNGHLWFATQDGVAVIDSQNLLNNSTPPKISLQRIIVDGQPLTPRRQMLFRPGKGNLQFEYTGICLQAPEKVRFQYRLEGVDSEWVDAGARRVAAYANVPPGKYRFLLRAGNNDEFWTHTPAAFALTLAPHFYQRSSFYGACIAAVILTIIVLHQMRVRQHQLQKQQLAELVDKRTRHLEEALQSMETFTYSIAHDLRAPLRTIRGMTSVLLDDYRKVFDAKALDYAQRIQKGVQKMEDLIRDLLIYGVVAHSHTPVEKVSLEKIFEQVLGELKAELQARKGVIEMTNTQPAVMANPLLLQQVLTNLVSNGLKFVAPEKPPHVRIWTKQFDHTVRIFVQDNGIGIHPKYSQRIFGLFERLHPDTEYPGTGVGLAIVQKGVERMGGKAGVESETGKGSCFWLELPAAV
jgi:ligand-binding sensor domain-containing protein/signal transduction histidine kinase